MSEKVLWNPGVAAVLSLVLPGAGHVYRGSIGKGLLWLVVVAGCYAIFLPLGLIPHLLCVFMAASGRNTAPDPDAPTPETHVKCPDCRELVLRDARKCKHCGCGLVPQ